MKDRLKKLRDQAVSNILAEYPTGSRGQLKLTIESEIKKIFDDLFFNQLLISNFKQIPLDISISDDMNKYPWKYLTHYNQGHHTAYLYLNDLWYYYDIAKKQWLTSFISNENLEKTLILAKHNKETYKKYFK